MSELKDNIIRLSVFVIAVILCSFIISLFQKKPKENNNYELLIAAKDSLIKSVSRERDTFRQWKDDVILALQKKDSLLTTQYKTTVIKYEKIPVLVSNYSDAELRSAVENFR